MLGMDALYDKVSGFKRAISPHMAYLRELASESDMAVEFGTRGGGSTVALNYARETRSYDIQRRARDEKVWRPLSKIRGDRWVFTIKSSLDVEIPECDLLLHDSLHQYQHVRDELELHHERVGKWIVLHDTEAYGEHGQAPYQKGSIGTKPDLSQPGMCQALDEFMAAHPEWEQVRHVTFSHGLTTLGRR